MRALLHGLLDLIYPPRCVLCHRFLEKEETGLCRRCRTEVAEYVPRKTRIPYVADKTALWYYEGVVRESLLRYKFRGVRSHAQVYGQLLAMRLRREEWTFDLMTWVPISAWRSFRRGYDQVALIAQVVAKELEIPATPTLKKVRNNPPQSRSSSPAERRANVLGVYRVLSPEAVAGKRILLLDDIITTGATLSECARVLRTAGAKEVLGAAVAASRYQ